MKAGVAKDNSKKEELGVTACVNPAMGQTKVAAYIAGDLTDSERRDFVAHIADCMCCLKEVVLWYTAEELAQKDDRPRQLTQTA